MEVPTLKIKHTDGYTVINRDDFDPSVHERWEVLEVSEVSEVQTVELPTVQPSAPPKVIKRRLKKQLL